MSKINQMKYPVSTCRRDVKAPPSPTVPPLLAIPSSASLTLINIFPPEWAPHARARAEDQPYNYLFLTFPASACYEDHVTLPETTRIKAMIVTAYDAYGQNRTGTCGLRHPARRTRPSLTSTSGKRAATGSGGKGLPGTTGWPARRNGKVTWSGKRAACAQNREISLTWVSRTSC